MSGPELSVQVARDQAFEDAETTIEQELTSSGHADPSRWVLNRVARAVGRMELSLPRTSDWCAFLEDWQIEDDLWDNLRFAAAPKTLRALMAKGFIPALDEARALRTGVVQERYEQGDLSTATARFDATCEGEYFGEDLWDEDLDAALTWARSRATTVRLRIAGSGEFSAGEQPLAPYPRWDGRPVRRRRI